MGLKANQTHLYRYCICRILLNAAEYEQVDKQKEHHRRLEQRTYRYFSLKPSALAPRWQDTGVVTLIQVERHRQQAGVVTQSVSYFVSNSRVSRQLAADELFGAIGQHWSVEVMHHKGDVSLAEDKLRTSIEKVSRLLGSLRTLIINLLEGSKCKNMAARLETFADKFPTLVRFLTQQMILQESPTLITYN